MGQSIKTRVAAYGAAMAAFVLCAPAHAQNLWINEIHYDNAGSDVGEFVEVVVADIVATDPADIAVVRYNGGNGAVYGVDTLDTSTSTTVPGYTIHVLDYPSNGLQNGSPDGLALVADGALVQFLSYEGVITATDGPAQGQTSVDIGVSELNAATGTSLQLSGTGSQYSDFTWQGSAAETPDLANNAQTLEPLPVALNEFGISDVGLDAEFFEIAGAASTDLSNFDLVVLDPTGLVVIHVDLTGSIPADGLWTATSPAAETEYGVVGDQSIPDNLFANDTRTYLLVTGFTGAVSDDLDTDNDGTLDSEPWTERIDDLAIIDADGETIYSATTAGPDGTFLPPGAERCPDGTGAWSLLDFNPPNGTPGTPNGCAAPTPPVVVAVSPPDGATGVPVSASITINFDQAIDATASAVALSCGKGLLPFSGLPQSGVGQLVITPNADLPDGVTCDVTVFALDVTSNTGSVPMDADFSWSFETGGGAVEIFEIQGAGTVSPLLGQLVSTEGNVVTAVSANGFFMQTPDARADASIDTSNGLFVFVGGAPGVAVGDVVDVTGEVIEFQGFTEFSNGPAVSVVSAGAPLPTAVQFNGSVPSPDPMAPSCAIEFECYEGMRISMPQGVIGEGNQFETFQPLSEVVVKAGGQRSFREPGITAPGIPGLPVWDGNPEIFRLSPTALGLPAVALFGGTRIQAEGVLAFNTELWPTQLTVLDAPTLPGTVPPAPAGQVSVGSINMLRFFDDVDDPGIDEPVEDPATYAARLARFADHVVNAMGGPEVVAVQEVEGAPALQDLANEIAGLNPALVYSVELVEGNDVGGIDVGYLVRDDVTILAVDQLGEDELLSFDGSLLHDRPPLLLQARFTDGVDTLDVNLLAVHNRSLGGIEGPEATRIKTKRLEQAQSIAQMVQDLQTAQPSVPVVVIGDFNAFEFTDGYVDVTGQVAGVALSADNEFWSAPITSPPMDIVTFSLPEDERYSFVFEGNAQALDHALISRAGEPHFDSMIYTRGSADAPEVYRDAPPVGEEELGVSDHDSFVIRLLILAERVFRDGFESDRG